MRTGIYISGIGHLLLILWLLFGGLFSRVEEAEFAATDVTIMTEEEFAALVEPFEPSLPEPSVDIAEPRAPDEPDTPALPETEDIAEAAPPPDAPDPAEPEAAPDLEEIAPLPRPEVAPDIPVTPAPPSDTGTETPPVTAPEADPSPAERVAPEAAPQPEPEAEIAENTQEAVTPAESPEAEAQEQEATAPEEAAPEIVTEAEESEQVASAAPLVSRRPVRRPERPAPEVEDPAPEPEPEPEPSDPVAEAVGDALAEANEVAPENPPRPAGPPLTAGEREGLRVAVQKCWNVDVGSEAANVTVVVGMSMNRDGTVVSGSLQLLSSEGGAGRAVQTAFQSARRAVLRCQRDGYELPVEKYDRWRDIEITFNPERMRRR